MKKMGLMLAVIFLILVLPASLVFAGGGREGAAAAGAAGKVSVMAVWGGQELEVFKEMLKPFEAKTGIKVEYEGTRDLDAVLTTRVEAGNPPDIAGLPGPGKMAEFARARKLVDLSTVLDMNVVKRDYGQSWIDLGTVDGTYVGLFTKASIKGLIWYSPKQQKASGFTIPKTWDEMLAVSKAIAAKGVKPWAIGIESGAASGWVGTDWLENIFLKMYGPAKYKDWYDGKLSWTSAEMKAVWMAFGQIVADPNMIYGGKQYVLSTNFGQAPQPLFTNPPGAAFHHQASFIVGFIKEMFPDVKPMEDYNFFQFPSINAAYAKSVEAGGDVFGMFRDTPQARELMKYLASPEAQAYWVSGTGALSPNKGVSLVFYPDDISKQSAKILNESQFV
ncbi:MAG: carbohydrate ABC transporter substrate-binding protein, partial [Spirochaetales bacterium]